MSEIWHSTVKTIAEGGALEHHGIKGQKWGVRRFQNADGSLTAKGKKRYDRLTRKINKLEKRSKRYSDILKKRKSMSTAKRIIRDMAATRYNTTKNIAGLNEYTRIKIDNLKKKRAALKHTDKSPTIEKDINDFLDMLSDDETIEIIESLPKDEKTALKKRINILLDQIDQGVFDDIPDEVDITDENDDDEMDEEETESTTEDAVDGE